MNQHQLTDQVHRYESDKRAWEDAIRAYTGTDPLDMWFNYICWLEQHKVFDKDGGFRKILEQCLSNFENFENYKQDGRMVKLWMKFIDMQANPLNLYQFLYKKNVGTQCACFYIGWAHYYDAASAFKQAESIYNLGIQVKAQPMEELQEAQNKFRLSIAQRMLYNDASSKKRSANTLVEQRQQITSLSPPQKKLKTDAGEYYQSQPQQQHQQRQVQTPAHSHQQQQTQPQTQSQSQSQMQPQQQQQSQPQLQQQPPSQQQQQPQPQPQLRQQPPPQQLKQHLQQHQQVQSHVHYNHAGYYQQSQSHQPVVATATSSSSTISAEQYYQQDKQNVTYYQHTQHHYQPQHSIVSQNQNQSQHSVTSQNPAQHSIPPQNQNQSQHPVPAHSQNQPQHSIPPQNLNQPQHSFPSQNQNQSQHSIPPQNRNQSQHSIPPQNRNQSQHSIPPQNPNHTQHSIAPQNQNQSQHSMPPQNQNLTQHSIALQSQTQSIHPQIQHSPRHHHHPTQRQIQAPSQYAPAQVQHSVHTSQQRTVHQEVEATIPRAQPQVLVQLAAPAQQSQSPVSPQALAVIQPVQPVQPVHKSVIVENYGLENDSSIECNLNNSAYVISSSLNYVYDDTNLTGYSIEEQQTEENIDPVAIRLPGDYAREARSNHERWDVPLCLEEPYDPNRRCCYPKGIVYPDLHTGKPTMEFSIEEIRARKWYRRKEELEAQKNAKQQQLEQEKQRQERQRQLQLQYQQQISQQMNFNHQHQQQQRNYQQSTQFHHIVYQQQPQHQPAHQHQQSVRQSPVPASPVQTVSPVQPAGHYYQAQQHQTNQHQPTTQAPHLPSTARSAQHSSPAHTSQQQPIHQPQHHNSSTQQTQPPTPIPQSPQRPQVQPSQHPHIQPGQHPPLQTNFSQYRHPYPHQNQYQPAAVPVQQQQQQQQQPPTLQVSPAQSHVPYPQHSPYQTNHYGNYSHQSFSHSQPAHDSPPVQTQSPIRYAPQSSVQPEKMQQPPPVQQQSPSVPPQVHQQLSSIPQPPPSIPQPPPSIPKHPPSIPQPPPSIPKQPPSIPQPSPSVPRQPASVLQSPLSVPQQPPSVPQQPPSVPQSPPYVPQQPPSVLRSPPSAPQQPPALQSPPSVPQQPPSVLQSPPYVPQQKPPVPQTPPMVSQHQSQQSYTSQVHVRSQTPARAQSPIRTPAPIRVQTLMPQPVKPQSSSVGLAGNPQTMTNNSPLRPPQQYVQPSPKPIQPPPLSIQKPVIQQPQKLLPPSSNQQQSLRTSVPITATPTATTTSTGTSSTSNKFSNCDDFEEQIEASTIRFSTSTENGTSKSKTITIKFKKEKTTYTASSPISTPVSQPSLATSAPSSSSSSGGNDSNKKSKKVPSVTASSTPVVAGSHLSQRLLNTTSAKEKSKNKSKRGKPSGKGKPSTKHDPDATLVPANRINDANLLLSLSGENEDSSRSYASSPGIGRKKKKNKSKVRYIEDDEDEDDFDGRQEQYLELEEEEDYNEDEEEDDLEENDSSYQSNSEFNTSFSNISFAGDNSNGAFNFGGSSCSTPPRHTLTSSGISKTSTPVGSFRYLRKHESNLSFCQNEDSMNSTVVENSYFQTEHDEEAKRRRKEKALAIIDTHLTKPFLDPFSSELCKAFLTKIDFPSREHTDDYRLVNTNLPKLLKSQVASLGGTMYNIEKEVGRGSYGSVFRAVNSQTGAVVAIKYQKPANTWELYICTEVRKRIKNPNILPGFMDICSAVIAPNASVLVSEFSQYGSLLDINNKIRTATTKVMHESLVMHFSSQILSIVDYLHGCNIIHADIKPDNFLLMQIPSVESDIPTLRLIDFGCAIDMNFFEKKRQFKKVIQTDGFTCIEMQEGRPWSFQTDLFCVAGTIHVMLFGEYMQLTKKYDSDWDIKQKFPRYLKKHVWTEVFQKLLNIKDINHMPKLKILKELIDGEVFNMESELMKHIRTLSNLLKRR